MKPVISITAVAGWDSLILPTSVGPDIPEINSTSETTRSMCACDSRILSASSPLLAVRTSYDPLVSAAFETFKTSG